VLAIVGTDIAMIPAYDHQIVRHLHQLKTGGFRKLHLASDPADIFAKPRLEIATDRLQSGRPLVNLMRPPDRWRQFAKSRQFHVPPPRWFFWRSARAVLFTLQQLAVLHQLLECNLIQDGSDWVHQWSEKAVDRRRNWKANQARCPFVNLTRPAIGRESRHFQSVVDGMRWHN
jgi:hypothetical protein